MLNTTGMSQTDLFYKKLSEQLKEKYPQSNITLSQAQGCISPFKISLNNQTTGQIKNAIRDIYQWSRKKESSYSPDIDNYSVLMAYDFHIDSENNARLIEINTNASGFLITDLIREAHGIDNSKNLEKLKDSFIQEWKLFSKKDSSPQKIIITDEDIKNQKNYIEFLMYQQLINQWGWDCELLDADQIISEGKGIQTPQGEPIDFLYSRLTDFYLKRYDKIKKAYEEKQVCLSPNPKEYFLLANKKNLCELYSETPDDSSLKKVLIETCLFQTHLWENRKQFFFKPIESYGGKGSYNGKSISKIKFQTLKHYIAQKFIPPMNWTHPITQEQWKVDIRAYAYRNQIHQIGGRIYQGQLTNFQTPESGFCLVDYEDF